MGIAEVDDRKKTRVRFQQVNLLCDEVIRKLPTPTHALWLLVAWRHADVRRQYRKSTTEMAKQVGITKRHGHRIVADLVEIGAIKEIDREKRSGTLPAVYQITGKPRSEKKGASGDTHVTSRANASGDTHVP